MNTLAPLLRLSLREAFRGRWLLGVVCTLALTGELLIRFGGGGATTIVSLIDVVLILTPMLGLVAGTVQVHHAREMTELLLAQPVSRRRLFVGLYLGNVIPLASAILLGLVAPFLWHRLLFGEMGLRLVPLLLVAVGLTGISSALAFVVALRIDDRVRALGAAIGLWLIAAVVWDGIILLLAVMLGQRPVEAPMLAVLALNPIDVARVLLLLGSDAAALLGYTGAVVQHTLGTEAGRAALILTLSLWLALPLAVATRAFQRKSF
ncbi:MAG: ABC transporter permease subunit [Gemmatimonadales bacterium]